MLRFLKPRTLSWLGVGALALAMMQGQQVQAQFAWHGPTPTIATNALNTVSFLQAPPNTYGVFGNFELVVGQNTGGLAFWFRDNDNGQVWIPDPSGNSPFATGLGAVQGASLILSSFSTAAMNGVTPNPNTGVGGGNLGVVANGNGTLNYYFREDVTFTWSTPVTITTGAYGIPSFVQAKPGTYGTVGNYELVTPLATGGMLFYYRDNDDPSQPWIVDPNGPFATSLGVVDAVSLIQSSFSTQFQNTGTQGPGNLALVATIGNNLYYFEREDVTFTWSAGTVVFTGVRGGPSLIQAKAGTYGTVGNYEVVAPLQTGGIGHFYRDNDNGNVWSGPTATFGPVNSAGALLAVDATSLFQSSYSSELQNTGTQGPGNLAVASVSAAELDYFYRDDY
jgi:hypothetical protein